MARLVVTNLEDDVWHKLQEMAQRHGLTVEEEAHQILMTALRPPDLQTDLGSRLRSRFAAIGLDENESITELRGQPVQPPDFWK